MKQRFETLLVHHGFVIGNATALPPDTELSLELVLPEAAGTLTVAARVVDVRETPGGEEGPYALQLHLLDFDADKQATIRDLLDGEPAPVELELEEEVGDTSLEGIVSRWGFSERVEDP